MIELKVKGDFCAAHLLRGYEGHCNRLHGHTWKVEITIVSNQLDHLGMVVDFKMVKKNLKQFLEQLDHTYLNEWPAFQHINPTTENLAKYIYDGMVPICLPLKLTQVQVWESDLASIIYRAE